MFLEKLLKTSLCTHEVLEITIKYYIRFITDRYVQYLSNVDSHNIQGMKSISTIIEKMILLLMNVLNVK